MSFAPGLIEPIQNINPPAIEFFENLFSDYIKIWGIYVLVLKKTGAIPQIYIGSGTSFRDNILAHWEDYSRNYILSRLVDAAFRDRYKIFYKRLLISAPIFFPANIFISRLFFVAIEAAFIFYFWAIRSQDKDYGMGVCCP